MDNANTVYNSTTTADQQSKHACFFGPTEFLSKCRIGIKLLEVLFSFVAFVLEEIVSNCSHCAPLYFFEFVSCTAFLFTLLLLILLSTALHKKVGINCWPSLDFGYTAVIAVLFFLASAVFAANNNQTSLEHAAVVFGFLATLVFILDVGWFWKQLGIPCLKQNQPPVDNTQRPENEKLNANGTE